MAITPGLRKRESERRLVELGCEINPYLAELPGTLAIAERPDGVRLVAERAMALLVVAMHAEDDPLPAAVAAQVVEEYALGAALTADERAFLGVDGADRATRTPHLWRYESAWVLLWALGKVRELGAPTGTCPVPEAVLTLRGHTAEEFVAHSVLRPSEEILDAADLTHRLHWAAREALLRRQPAPPAGLDVDVLLERHHALSWLVRGGPWEDVETGV